MSDFERKTDYLTETKGLLKDRINSLGGSITSGTTFRDYLVWLDSLYEALEEKTITGLPDSLEGKCEQDGTPTPDSPIPINITTGRQVLSVCGKNLLNTNTFVKGRIDPANGQIQHPNGITDFNTTNNSITFTSNATWRGVASDFIPITTGNYYYRMSVSTSVSRLYVYVDYYDNEYNYISRFGNYLYTNGDTKTWLLSLNVQNASFIRIHYEMDQVGTTTITNPQLEKGNITTYEEYKGNDYEINLGKNLFNIDGTRTSEGITNTTTGTIISVSGTSTNTYSSLTQQITQSIPIGTYTFSIQEKYSKRIGFIPTFSDNTSTTYFITANTLSTTFTTTKEIKSYRLYMETTSGTTYNMTIKPQLEKGSVASSFSPYKTPIYLGKIGTYQDYIFRNTTENPLYDSNLEEGQWYIHKEIGRVVLNGSEQYVYQQNTNDTYLYRTGAIFNDLENYSTNYITNYFGTNNTSYENTTLGSYVFNHQLRMRVPSSIATTDVNVFKTWLSTHNTEVYYVLNTPTNTLIEDEELINQLNEIEIFTVISEDFYN